MDRSGLLGSAVFINDIALDPQGNAYVTNSLSPFIHKITPDGEASVFINEPSLALRSRPVWIQWDRVRQHRVFAGALQ